MRREAAQVVIAWRNADWVQRKKKPVKKENQTCGDPLNLRLRKREDKNDGITEADLSEHVWERPVSALAPGGLEKQRQSDEGNGPPDRVQKHARGTFTTR